MSASPKGRAFAAAAASAAVLLGAVACGSASSSGQDSPTVAAPKCGDKPPAAAKSQQFPAEPKVTVAPAPYTATIVTNCGTIVATLDAAKAPHTVNSFSFLASKNYFDNTPCHRLTTQGIFVLQCGDPTGSGSGGPGYTIPDENLTGATYPAGTLAMANTGQPHTGGSQFFICYADTDLPPSYTPFGKVTQGLDVLTQIAKNGEDDSNGPGDGKPNKPVYILSFTVDKA